MDKHTPLTTPEFDPGDVVTSEEIKHERFKSDRSAARYVALQVLYEVDSVGHRVGDVMNEQLSLPELNTQLLQIKNLSDEASRILRILVPAVLENRDALDRVIQHYASEWPLAQVAIIDRNILRLAICEFALLKLVSPAIAIDEAVHLAKWFGSEGTPRFVNGVLGAVANDLKTVETMFKGDDEA